MLRFIREKIIYGISLTFFVLSGYYLFLKEPELVEETRTNFIDHLSKIVNTVKIKKSGKLTWINSLDDQKVFSMDQIFTNEESTTSLVYKDKSVLKINTSTLIQISSDEKGNQVDLKDGLIFYEMVKKSKGVTIKAGKQKLKIDSKKQASLQIFKPKGKKEASLTLLKGDIKVEVGEKKLEIKKNQNLEISQTGEIEIKEILITLDKPISGEEIFIGKDTRIAFNWKVPEKAKSKFLIKIGKDYNLEKDLIAKETSKTYFNQRLQPGNYFWRVENEYKGKLSKSIVESFTIFEDSPPRPLRPYNDKQIKLKDDSEDDNQIQFVWSEERTEGYQIQFFKLTKGKKDKPGEIILTENTSKPLYAFNGIKEGSYKWRVKVDDPSRPKSEWSSFNHFSVIPPTRPLMPSLNEPEDQITRKLHYQKPISQIFKWKTKIPQDNYQLEIATDEDFSNILQNVKTAQSYYLWNPEKPQKYFWRVKSVLEDKESSYTTIRSLNVALPKIFSPPVIKSKLNEIVPRKNKVLDIKFKEIAGAQKYHFQILNQPQKEQVYDEEIKTTKISWDFEEFGKYLVKIAAYDRWDRVGKYSKTQLLIEPQQYTKQLITLLFPSANQTVKLKSKKQDIELTWTPIDQAKEYKIAFFTSSKKKKANLVFSSAVNMFQVPYKKLKSFLKKRNKKIYWEITTKIEDTTFTSERRNFKIKLKRKKRKKRRRKKYSKSKSKEDEQMLELLKGLVE